MLLPVRVKAGRVANQDVPVGHAAKPGELTLGQLPRGYDRPFPHFPEMMSKVTIPPVVMPERLAATDPFKQIPEAIGSGPFKYKADERVAGSLVVYERNAAYVPRPNGAVSGTAGPKVAHFDRIEWRIIQAPPTASASRSTPRAMSRSSPAARRSGRASRP